LHVRPVLGIIFPGLKNFLLNNFNQLSYLRVVWKCLKNLNQWEREDFRKHKKERKRFHEVLKLEFVVRPLSPSSDKKHLISPYNITTCSNIYTGPENKGNDHQK